MPIDLIEKKVDKPFFVEIYYDNKRIGKVLIQSVGQKISLLRACQETYKVLNGFADGEILPRLIWKADAWQILPKGFIWTPKEKILKVRVNLLSFVVDGMEFLTRSAKRIMFIVDGRNLFFSIQGTEADQRRAYIKTNELGVSIALSSSEPAKYLILTKDLLNLPRLIKDLFV